MSTLTISDASALAEVLHETFWPVRDLMAEVITGEFAPDYS